MRPSTLTVRVGYGAAAVAMAAAAAPLSSTTDSPTDRRSAAAPAFCHTDGAIRAAWLVDGVSTAGCNLEGRTIVHGSTAVLVPASGSGAGLAGLSAGGGRESHLQVVNAHGVVTAYVGDDQAPSAPAGATAAAAPAACRDKAYKLAYGGHPWKIAMKWRYHARSTPARFGKKQALLHIKRGMKIMRDARDDCGLRGEPRLRASYVGKTRVRANIFSKDGEAKCGQVNKTNSIDWGRLPKKYLGLTCYWWNGQGNMFRADISFDKNKITTIGIPRKCRYRFDLQAISAHEFGHAFGLMHPGKNHKNLTMSPTILPCSTAQRTVGKGDWRGMRDLYGIRR